jgi:rRNA maturation endonuclease Nob1
MFRRCVECELVVMPRPFMVCDDCGKRNDRMNARIQWVSRINGMSDLPSTKSKDKK